MIAFLREYFQERHWTPYDPERRRYTLSIVLWCTLVAGVLMGAVNFYVDEWQTGSVLFAMSLLCVVALWSNRHGHYILASLVMSVVVVAAAGYNLTGANGIRDPGVVVYPILVIFGSLLFGKRASPIFALVGILSVTGVAYLSTIGAVRSIPDKHTIIDGWVISILIIASAILTWVVMDTLEKDTERIKRNEENLRVTYDITLEGWARALDYRDRTTEGHSRRVVEMCVRLARELGCSDEELAHIRRGALLHDIGKMAIPDHILFKPSELSQEEWEIIQQHPVWARDMLAGIPFLQPALSIPYCHHERWDGQGYPQGLKGEEIPLPARMFTVVDKFDALNSNRPYRAAWPREKSIAYLEENAGVIFDPKIVPIFLRLLAKDAFEI